jgi:hypothetical protein
VKFLTLGFVIVVAAVGAARPSAQAKPNLSGAWIGIDPQQGVRELTIKQDESTFTFDGQPSVTRQTFTLNGSESKMSGPDGKPLLATAVWKGDTLVVTVHEPALKQDIRRVTWALEGDGQLVIVTEILGPIKGERPAPLKNVFKRR